jgi:hypothetical protein
VSDEKHSFTLVERDDGTQCYCPSAAEHIGNGHAEHLGDIALCIVEQLPEPEFSRLLRTLEDVKKQREKLVASIEDTRQRIERGEPAGKDLGSFAQYADDDEEDRMP